jgi:hypothetical protein
MIEIGTNERRKEKPLKRFFPRSFVFTRLKPGVNESRKRMVNGRKQRVLDKSRGQRVFSLTPRFSGVLAKCGEGKTVSTVFHASEGQE